MRFPMAQRLEDLLVWQKGHRYCDAVNALLERPEFRKDLALRDQIRDAIDSILSNIAEGFEQPTDRSFALYLYRSKASTAESRARLWTAAKRRYVHRSEYETQKAAAIELARMLTGFIKYLRRSDLKDRGLGRSLSKASEPTDE